MKKHFYSTEVSWTGNTGSGTRTYSSYERSHTIIAGSKDPVLCSSDPAFRGDLACYNPEELFLGSIAACHMLWFLHLCSAHGVVVQEYEDSPEGTMVENSNGSGKFVSAVLKPVVTLENIKNKAKAEELHKEAHKFCFLANSVDFPITCQARFTGCLPENAH